MYSIALIRKLASISSLLVCGLGLTTLACSSAPASQLERPADDDDDDRDDRERSTSPTQSSRDDDDRVSSAPDRSLMVSVDAEVRIDPGKTVRVPVIIERGADLTGSGTITLTGLPDGISAEPTAIDAGENSVEVTVVASKNVAAGRSSGLLRAKVGTVEKTTPVTFVVGEAVGTRGDDWCASLAACCDDMQSVGEQLVCLANAGFVNDQDACKVHLLAYIAKGDCTVSVR